MLTLAAAEEKARDWCDAWNRRDLEAVLRHYSDRISLCSPLVVRRLGRADGWLHGKDDLRAYFARGMTNPDLRFTYLGVRVGVNAMTLLYGRENGVEVADTMELDADGRAVRMIACYREGDARVS